MIVGGIPMLFRGGEAWMFVAGSTPATGINAIATLPSGYAAGDLLIIVGAIKNVAPANPAGFTARQNASGLGDPRTLITDKIAGASESNVTVATVSNADAVVMLAYRNINTVSRLDVNGTLAQATSTAGGVLNTVSLTTTVANDLVLSVWTMKDRAGTWTAPAGVITRVNFQGNQTGTHCGFLIVDENKVTAGATTVRTGTYSNAQNMDSFAVSYKNV